MNRRTAFVIAMQAAFALAACALIAHVGWGPAAATGVLAGGGWNLASLWCLAQLLAAWLGPQPTEPAPSRRRAIVWLSVKFPLLYLAAFALLRQPGLSLIGFSVGFSLVLVIAVAALATHARQMVHGPTTWRGPHGPCAARTAANGGAARWWDGR